MEKISERYGSVLTEHQLKRAANLLVHFRTDAEETFSKSELINRITPSVKKETGKLDTRYDNVCTPEQLNSIIQELVNFELVTITSRNIDGANEFRYKLTQLGRDTVDTHYIPLQNELG